jgi:hypothetical protein
MMESSLNKVGWIPEPLVSPSCPPLTTFIVLGDSSDPAPRSSSALDCSHHPEGVAVLPDPSWMVVVGWLGSFSLCYHLCHLSLSHLTPL